MTEAQLLASVLKLAHLFRWEPYHTHDSRRSYPGFPDLVLAKPGRPVIYAELKDGDGVVTEDQEKWLALLRATPSQVFVWRPDDLQDIARILGT